MKKALTDTILFAAAALVVMFLLSTGMLVTAIIKGDVDTVTLEPVSVQEQIRNEQRIQGLGGY